MSTQFSVLAFAERNPVVRLYKHYIIDSILIVKRSGFKELLRKRGWRFILFIVSYYLVRDTLLYVVIPYCIARGFY